MLLSFVFLDWPIAHFKTMVVADTADWPCDHEIYEKIIP